MNILIPIETSTRELIYKLNLCHHLALKGFCCYLGRKSYINYLIKNLKGYIYLDKGYHKSVSEKIYETVRKNDGIIVSLDEEGGVVYSDGSILLARYSKALFNNVDLTFMWGEKQHELVKKNMSKENKVAVTGHPRFELLKPEFHYLYQDEVDKIKKRFNNYILINTNMGFGNNIRGDKFVESKYGNWFKNIDQIIAFDKKKLEAYRLLVLDLSDQLNKTIVLRPHPEEDLSFYSNAFKGRKNIHIVYAGSVIPWLLASEIMIHPDCTTAIESLFIGKKPISYMPDDYSTDLATHLPLDVSECFTTKSELIAYIKNTNNVEDIDLGNYSFAENYFSISKSATKLIVDEIIQLGSKFPNNPSNRININDLLYLKISAIKSVLKKILKFDDRLHQLFHQKSLGFNSKNIRYMNKIIIKHNNQFSAIKCKTINSNLFLYQNSN